MRENKRNVTVIGCGRWGSFLAWYLDRIGHAVTLYGREGSRNMRSFLDTRSNGLLTLPESVMLSTSLSAVDAADVVVVSVDSQGLRALLGELSVHGMRNKTVVLCMKGLEISSGKRLSEVATECLDESCSVAVWQS